MSSSVPTARRLVTLKGKSPATVPPYSFALLARLSCMLIQSSTFCAVTGWPLLQLYFLSLMVTCRPEYVGG